MKYLLLLSLLCLGCSKEKEPTKVEKVEVSEVNAVQKEEVVTIPTAYLYRYDEMLESMNVGDYWNTYKRVRGTAKELSAQQKYTDAVDSLLLAAECMIKVGEKGIASWQFNNAGKNSIDEFMIKSNYRERVAKINTLPLGEEKSKYIKETQNLYKKEIALLKWGKLYLNKALQCNDDEFDKKREKAINNNLSFVNEIENFMTL